jgi:hypothetical protein
MTGILIFIIFTLTVAVLGGYTIVAPWWRTRAGKAYFILFCSLAMLAGFFLVEALTGHQPDWAKNVVLGLVAAAIAWNLYTIISKQLYYWRMERPNARPDLTDPQI